MKTVTLNFDCPNRRPHLTRMICHARRVLCRPVPRFLAIPTVRAATWLIVNYCLEGPWNKRRW